VFVPRTKRRACRGSHARVWPRCLVTLCSGQPYQASRSIPLSPVGAASSSSLSSLDARILRTLPATVRQSRPTCSGNVLTGLAPESLKSGCELLLAQNRPTISCPALHRVGLQHQLERLACPGAVAHPRTVLPRSAHPPDRRVGSAEAAQLRATYAAFTADQRPVRSRRSRPPPPKVSREHAAEWMGFSQLSRPPGI